MTATTLPLRRAFGIVTCSMALGLGCGAEPDAAPSLFEEPSGGSTSGGSTGVAMPGVAGSPNPLGVARCQPPPGMNGSPQTIEEAIQLLNALPKPTSVACFVQSLDRPLTAYATNSKFSAQPAFSSNSPRLFFKLNRLWLSVVIDGDSSYLVEFSYLQPDDARSIKGEVLTPLTEALAPSAPYDRVRFGTGTACGLCHYDEQAAPSVSFTQAFASIAFRPRPDTRVGLDKLLAERQRCDWSVEPHRCEILSAVFDGGTVVEEVFPATMPTFF